MRVKAMSVISDCRRASRFRWVRRPAHRRRNSDDEEGQAAAGFPDRSLRPGSKKQATKGVTKLPRRPSRRPRNGKGSAPILVATLGGPTMFARIGVMRALNAGKPIRRFVPPRKRANAYKVIR